MNQFLRTAVLLTSMLFAAAPCQALLLPLSMGEMLSRTDAVATGTIKSIDPHNVNFTLEVATVLFGDDALSETLSLRAPQIGCRSQVRISPGLPVLVCLERNPHGQLEITGNDQVGIYVFSSNDYPPDVPEFVRAATLSFRPDELAAVLRDRDAVRAEILRYLQAEPDLSVDKIESLRATPPPQLRKFTDRSKLYHALYDVVLVHARNYYHAKSRGLTEQDKTWIEPEVWEALSINSK